MWLYKQKPFEESQQSVKFGGCRHCGSKGKMVLVCEMISQDHGTK